MDGRRRGAFTLVELLVVVAILALLLTMLMPTLGRAKEIARQTFCMTNLKPVGTAINFYHEDNNGYQVARFRQTVAPSGSPWWSRTWFWSDFLVQYCDDSARAPDWGHGKTSIQPKNGIYARERFSYSRLLNCPSQPNRDHSEYAWNMIGGWQEHRDAAEGATYWEPSSGPVHSSIIERPGDFIKLIDAGRLDDQIYWMDGEFNGAAHHHVRNLADNVVHLGTDNAMMYDGHVEKITAEAMHKFADELQYDYWHRTNNGYPFYPRDVRSANHPGLSAAPMAPPTASPYNG